MSYYCRLGANLCSFGSRLRLRNSHASDEQSVRRLKRLLTTYYLKWLMAHKTARHSRSVVPRQESVFEKRCVAKARTRSSCPTGCRSTAPLAPALPASVSTTPMELSPANDICGCGRRCWSHGACFAWIPCYLNVLSERRCVGGQLIKHTGLARHMYFLTCIYLSFYFCDRHL